MANARQLLKISWHNSTVVVPKYKQILVTSAMGNASARKHGDQIGKS